MNSIKKRVLLSYLTIIACVITLSIITVVVNYYLVSQYEQVNSNIVEIQALSDEASGLTGDAYNGFQTNSYSKYDQRVIRVRAIEKNLDMRFGNNQVSLIAYRGVKNSLEAVTKNISEVRKQLQKSGDLDSLSTFYKENTTQYDYAAQSITDLTLAEDVNLAKVTQQMEKLKVLLIYLTIAIFILGTLIATVLAVVFSNRLIDPLVSLAFIAGKITSDNLVLSVEEKMIKRQDEIGSLFRAFESMLRQIREKIEKINESNAQLEKTKKIAEESLKDLENLNNLMVGRELKMIELKKEIALLKEELAKHV
jgi:methyl-accepting chemotaxis protein